MSIGGTGDGSLALEVKLDLAAKTAKIVWMYKTTIQNDVTGTLAASWFSVAMPGEARWRTVA